MKFCDIIGTAFARGGKQLNIEILSKDIKEEISVLKVGATEEGKILSTGYFTFCETSFSETFVKSVLPGGIGTLVENRRGGNIRKMFDFMHNYAAENDVAVSVLHPFSFSYYEQFGYNKVADHLILRFPVRMIDFVPRRCNFVPYEKKMLPDVLSIYNSFSRGRNLLPKRYDDSQYTREGRQTYVYYDKGKPSAYVTFSFSRTFYVNHYENTLLTVNEMAYDSPNGLREIFSFLRMFEGEFDEIELPDCSLCHETDLLLKHYVHTKYTRVPDLAARIIDTEKMLNANSYPEKEGEFTLRIVDTMPTVSGVYNVCYGGNEHRVRRMNDGIEADITLSATTLSRIIYGYDTVDANSAEYSEGVEIHKNCDDFFRAFPKRPCGAFEHF